MYVVLAASLFLILGHAGADFLLPLWAVDVAGMRPSDWAGLRSLRWLGTTIAILPIGLLTERIGLKTATSLYFALAGLLIIGISLGTGATAVWILPVLGGCISAIYVCMNTFTQKVSVERRGLANGLYRGCGTFIGILVPLTVVSVAQAIGGWSAAIAACGAVMLCAAPVIVLYPLHASEHDRTPFRKTLRNMWGFLVDKGYRRYLALDILFMTGVAPIEAFAILRVTRELGVSASAWGLMVGVSGAFSLVWVVLLGARIDSWGLARMTCVAWCFQGLSSVCLGLVSSGMSAAILAIALGVFATGRSITFSLWISKLGGTQASSFTLHKIMQAATAAVALALVGLLEPSLGMAGLLAAGGCLCLLAAVGMAATSQRFHDREATHGHPRPGDCITSVV